MTEDQFREVAKQLRQPTGEAGVQMSIKMNESNQLINQYTIEAIKISSFDKILEIGMGNGLFVKDILQKNETVHYTGLDFSELMIQEASKINEKFILQQRANFVFGNANELPFQSNTFTKVFTINTLYFWDDKIKTLSEITRVLKPGGKLLIAIRPKHLMEKYPFTKYGFTMYSKDEIIELLSSNKFNIQQIIEKQEPDREMTGIKVKVETLIIAAEKQ